MRVATNNGTVVLSRSSGERILAQFCSAWPMPVVRLHRDSDFGADFGVVFQVGQREVWAFLHLLPPELPRDIELVLELLQQACTQAMARLGDYRMPGILLPCIALQDDGDGRLVPGLAVFASDCIVPPQAGEPESHLCDTFIDLLSVSVAGAQLAAFAERRFVPRLHVGSIKFDSALVWGQPLSFRLPPEDGEAEAEEQALLTDWAGIGVKHMAWAPAIPIFLSEDEAASLALAPDEASQHEPGLVQAPEPDPESEPELIVAPEPDPEPEPELIAAPEPDPEPEPAPDPEPEPELPDAPEPELPDAPEPASAPEPVLESVSESDAQPSRFEPDFNLPTPGDPFAPPPPPPAVPLRSPSVVATHQGASALGPLHSRPTLPVLQTDAELPAEAPAEPTTTPDTDLSPLAPEAGAVEAVDLPAIEGPAAVPSTAEDAAERTAHARALRSIGHHGPTVELVEGLLANPFASLLRVGGDRVHTALLADALRCCIRHGFADALPDWLGPLAADATVACRPPSADILVEAGDDGGCAIWLRLADVVDAVALARAHAALPDSCTRRVVILPSPLLRLELPEGWIAITVDSLRPIVDLAAEVGGHPGFYRPWLDYLESFVALRDGFLDDARTDARRWREPLAETGLLPVFERILYFDVLDAALENIDRHNWPKITGRALADRVETRTRALAPSIYQGGDGNTLDLTVVDPESVHCYGLRAQGGLVGVFSERFAPARAGLSRTLVWGRRNAFLRDLCRLVQVDAREIIELPDDDCRVLPLGGYDMLHTPDRRRLTRALVETTWVLWDRVREGRLDLDE